MSISQASETSATAAKLEQDSNDPKFRTRKPSEYEEPVSPLTPKDARYSSAPKLPTFAEATPTNKPVSAMNLHPMAGVYEMAGENEEASFDYNYIDESENQDGTYPSGYEYIDEDEIKGAAEVCVCV